MMYETERLYARHLRPEDLDDLAALCADPIAMQYMDDGETLPRDMCAKWIDICQEKYAKRGYGTSAIIEKGSDAFVGFCGVVRPPENDFDEIIYALAQPYWGKGYATEIARGMLDYVFSISQLDKIYATIYSENTASLKVMDKLNMHFEKDELQDDGHITKYYVIERPSDERGPSIK
ncbi:GNAT family N-acetyltransferase [Phototrophicus methaneseepsis]|uniref:GNAT family N-acetyltransferase n=1 Tax=Phototrophicus methaneseepsis TaxID=2710758 RepID=A0A7S8IF77_9CHLR|nr:GNAT family N-acetyltransferase [Phototrophicus methaneseepsis]QPC82648.1 GNAT family N-acetyltransferase [Phototrophicus methaneseepsis]